MAKKFFSMSQENKQIRLISEGKQIGARFSFVEHGKTIWCSLGIQFHDGKFKVYLDEIEEGKMDVDEYRKDVGISFTSVSDALDWVRENTQISLDELQPCKGLKIFNPVFID